MLKRLICISVLAIRLLSPNLAYGFLKISINSLNSLLRQEKDNWQTLSCNWWCMTWTSYGDKERKQ